MKRKTQLVALSIFVCVAPITAAAPGESTEQGVPDELVQYATLNSLMHGVYEGGLSMSEMKKLGDFGIGTLNSLDGEMLALDGNVFQITSDGKVGEVADEVQTPFTAMTFFNADQTHQAPKGLNFETLKRFVESKLPSRNLFYAVKISGQFPSVITRSVEKQRPPYRPLAEVVKTQSTFNLNNTSGTLVGFWCPEYANGINVAGHHYHYMNDAKSEGGHILGLTAADVTVQIDELADFRMILPEQGEFLKARLDQTTETAIKAVEQISK